jgi:enamine deaminase RidA (YjgF/YER057c/UK114 family)
MELKTIELKDCKELYLSINPSVENDRIGIQLMDILSKIKKILKKEGGESKSIIKMAVFISKYNSKKACEKVLKDYYKTDIPSISFIVMPPFKGSVAVEIWAIIPKERESVKVTYSRKIPGKLAFVEHEQEKYLYLTGVWSDEEDIKKGALLNYERINRILKQSRFKPEDVFRYWLYLKNINGKERYAQLNQARTEYFKNLSFSRRWSITGRNSYPSSTGIGTKGPNVLIELVALQGGAQLIPIENPFQTHTDKYSKGQSVGNYTPKFCRAMVLKTDSFTKIFVSGTASIVGGETRHLGDVNAQTKETINNIKRLISKDNLNHYGLNKSAGLKDFLQLRVYIKKRDHFKKIRSICEKNFPNIPILYLNADICRDELLVEIEGLVMI